MLSSIKMNCFCEQRIKLSSKMFIAENFRAYSDLASTQTFVSMFVLSLLAHMEMKHLIHITALSAQ